MNMTVFICFAACLVFIFIGELGGRVLSVGKNYRAIYVRSNLFFWGAFFFMLGNTILLLFLRAYFLSISKFFICSYLVSCLSFSIGIGMDHAMKGLLKFQREQGKRRALFQMKML